MLFKHAQNCQLLTDKRAEFPPLLKLAAPELYIAVRTKWALLFSLVATLAIVGSRGYIAFGSGNNYFNQELCRSPSDRSVFIQINNRPTDYAYHGLNDHDYCMNSYIIR